MAASVENAGHAANTDPRLGMRLGMGLRLGLRGALGLEPLAGVASSGP